MLVVPKHGLKMTYSCSRIGLNLQVFGQDLFLFKYTTIQINIALLLRIEIILKVSTL
jgi:hypothetical protein